MARRRIILNHDGGTLINLAAVKIVKLDCMEAMVNDEPKRKCFVRAFFETPIRVDGELAYHEILKITESKQEALDFIKELSRNMDD